MNSKLKTDKRYLQRILNFAGYDCGKVDGIVGLKTLNAISRWEQDEDDARSICKLDERSEGNLTTMLPICQKLIRKWFRDKVLPWAEKRGVIVKIICGTRTYAEQDKLYNQRPKVTNARGGQSFHNFGIAADLGIWANGKYQEGDKLYRDLYTACGAPDGFTWGGNWKSIVDTPHYQYSAYGSTSSAIRAKFEG